MTAVESPRRPPPSRKVEGKHLPCHTGGFLLVLAKRNTAGQVREYNMTPVFLVGKNRRIAIVIRQHTIPLLFIVGYLSLTRVGA